MGQRSRRAWRWASRRRLAGRGRLEKLDKWGLVDVMPGAGELDEGRKD